MCSKSIETEAGFTKMERKNAWNINIFQNTWSYQKVSRLMLYLPRQIWRAYKTIIFFKIVPSSFNTSIPWVDVLLHSVKLCRRTALKEIMSSTTLNLNVLHYLKFKCPPSPQINNVLYIFKFKIFTSTNSKCIPSPQIYNVLHVLRFIMSCTSSNSCPWHPQIHDILNVLKFIISFTSSNLLSPPRPQKYCVLHVIKFIFSTSSNLVCTPHPQIYS